MGNAWLSNTLSRKDLGIVCYRSQVEFEPKCSVVTKKVNTILGCRSHCVLVPLY